MRSSASLGAPVAARLPRRRPAQDRSLVWRAQGGRSRLRRRGRGVSQHQHARGTRAAKIEEMNTPALTIAQASCADDYDPNSMPVAKARAFIHQFLAPIEGTVRVPIRSALGRILAEDVHSPVDVPSHRNSAMDGWAMRGADLKADGETTLQEIGASFAGKP